MEGKISDKKVSKQISKNLEIVKPKDKVILAISGGVDSMFLLHFLSKILKKEQLIVATLDHMLRKESIKDIALIKKICNKKGIEFINEKHDIKKIASENKEGIEECGRRIRYDFFRKVKKIKKAKWIITAHNKDDLAETIIMHIIRGTFVHGLVGIKKIHKDVLRPILNFTKDEIYQTANDLKLEWREDVTNTDLKYNRNYVRHVILKNFKKYHSDILDVFENLSKKAEKASDLIKAVASKMINNQYKELSIKSFNKMNIFIKKEVICHIFEHLYSSKKDITDSWLKEILKFIGVSRNGKIKEFGEKYILIKNYEKLLIEKNDPKSDQDENKEMILKIPGKIRWRGHTIEAKEIKKSIDFHKVNCYLCYLDKQLIDEKSLIVRSWRNGDSFRPFGMKGKKKLQDFFSDMKIRQAERKNIPVITNHKNDIIWIVGHRMDDRFKITKDTKKILELQLKINN